MIEKFIVVELQTISEQSTGNFLWAFDERADAEAKYHSVLSVAAKSGLPCHAAIIMRNDGAVINKQAYKVEPPPETPPVQEGNGDE